MLGEPQVAPGTTYHTGANQLWPVTTYDDSGWPITHAKSCESECDGTERICKCSNIGPCWHHR